MATQNIFDLTDTWNNVATTFTAIKMNVTDTASASGSFLIDLQVGGSTRFNVTKTGTAVSALGYETIVGQGAFTTTGRGGFRMSADGVMFVFNTARTDFDRIQLGGSTSAFPAISRDGAGVKFVGADTTNVSWVKVPAVAVASLPAAATAGIGARAFVNNASAPTFGSAVVGGGAVAVPVYSTGAAWNVG
jgi:hypothetical protein